MKTAITVLVLLLAIVGSAAAQLQHDISVDSMISPRGYIDNASRDIPIIHVTNQGLSDEYSFPVICIILDRYGVIVYRDSIWVDTLIAGQSKDVRFSGFTPLTLGLDQFCFTTLLATDQNKGNDRLCGTAVVRITVDFRAVSIVAPKQNDSIAYGSRFQAIATFQNVGIKEAVFGARIQIQ